MAEAGLPHGVIYEDGSGIEKYRQYAGGSNAQSSLIQFFGVEPLDFSSDPLGLAIIALAAALCSTSLGIFIASLVKTEAQVGGLSSVLLFVAGLVSGSFIPLFLMAPFFENIGRFLPQYWANQAFFGLVFRGQSLLEVWPNIVALLVFTVDFFGIGLWRFKFE